MNRRLTALFSTPWEAMAWVAVCVFLLGWFLSTIPNRRYLARIGAASKAAPEVEACLRGIKNVEVVFVTPKLDAVKVTCEVEANDDRRALRRLVRARYQPQLTVELRCKLKDPVARRQ